MAHERITVEASWSYPDSFQVFVSPFYADDLVEVLAAEGVEACPVVYAARGGSGDLLFQIIGAAGAAGSVAAALLAFFSRHKGKRFHLRFGDQEFTAEDCSPRQAQEWMRAALNQVEAHAIDWGHPTNKEGKE